MGLLQALAAVLLISLLMRVQCQSGDTEDWGSGSMLEAALPNASTILLHTDDPARPGNTYWAKPLFQAIQESTADDCTVHFHTSQATGNHQYRRLRAGREEVAYLKALQHGNQAVVENLVQFVGAEMGEHSYQEVIQENIAGIREDHASSEGVVKKAAEELENQLEGDTTSAQAGIQKIKEESLAFEQMLQAVADIARRLESSSQTLHVALTEQLRKSTRDPH